MQDNATSELALHLSLAGFEAILAFIVLSFAWKYHYFEFKSKPHTFPWKSAAEAFFLFIFLQFLIFPLFLSVIVLHFVKDAHMISQTLQGWLNVVFIILLGGFLAIFCYIKRKDVLPLFQSKQIGKDFQMGVLTWFIGYPIVLLVSQLISILLSDIWGYSLVDQLAVRQIKQTLDQPILFIATLVLVICIVPVIEELLFRGFLQGALLNFFTGKKGREKAILLSSILFTLFHFSLSQGINNVTILVTLFTLSLFLGFLKERQGNLWAPIGLHVTFNGLSVAMIFNMEY